MSEPHTEVSTNLFDYATSELSQDAFICWLASQSHEGANQQTAPLFPASQAFLRLLMRNAESELTSPIIVESIKRQENHIDVLLLANCDGNDYAVIIEDKVKSTEHDDQLKRYEDNAKQKYPDHTILKVYYQTGFQCDYSAVTKANYRIIGREDLIECLKDFANATHDAFLSGYVDHLTGVEEDAKNYKVLSPEQWNANHVMMLYKDIVDMREELGVDIDVSLPRWRGRSSRLLSFARHEEKQFSNRRHYSIYIQATMHAKEEGATAGNLDIQLSVNVGRIASTQERCKIRDEVQECLADNQFGKLSQRHYNQPPDTLCVAKRTTHPLSLTEAVDEIKTAAKDYRQVLDKLGLDRD
jgi:hypothetical protein